MLKLKRLYEGCYKIKVTTAITKSKSIAHVMIQKLGAAMGIHSHACQTQKNLCSQNF